MAALAAPSAWAATAPIAAEATHVEGAANVVSIRDAKTRPIALGMKFFEGDRIRTGAGVVEIEFDTGDLIRVDRDTDLTVQSLHRDEQGSTFSIFNLAIGRVKSAVTKLADQRSKFEYRTKTALCGVAGTPPFIVGFQGSRTFVDLLGAKGEPGAVSVRGFDPAQTLVTVLSGFRTTVAPGLPPQPPFEISPDRFRQLNRAIPFITQPKKERPKEPEAQAPPEKEKKEKEEPAKEEQPAGEPKAENGKEKEPEGKGEPVAKDKPLAPLSPEGVKPPAPPPVETLALDAITSRITKPRQVAPDQTQNLESVQTQSSSSQGVIGQNAEATGATTKPPPTVTVDVQILLK